jgi:hypothetical protein
MTVFPDRKWPATQPDLFGHVARDDADDMTGASDTWLTPRWLLDAFGPFDLDPCSDPSRHTPAKRHIVGIEDGDGLAEPWSGVVFCNCPYSRGNLPKWLAKCVAESDECKSIIALVPAAVGSGYWHDLVWPHAWMVGFPRGRLDFGGTDSPSFDSAIIIYGGWDAYRGVSATKNRVRWVTP